MEGQILLYTWTFQLVQLGLSAMFYVLTVNKTEDLFDKAAGVQLLLVISTLAATLILLVDVGCGVTLRDELRAIAVRPEVVIAQWVILRKLARRPGESAVLSAGPS